MNECPKESKQSTELQSKISAKKSSQSQSRIYQGDIFENIQIIENVDYKENDIHIDKIDFPYVICLNQECDLENDYRSWGSDRKRDSCLLHLAIAPVFLFDMYLAGKHWGDIFESNSAQKRKDTKVKAIMDNEIPRYHYLRFPGEDMPELIVDFKHFFTINRNQLYAQQDKRLCSIDDLFREKINQRFSYYISRIGLPEK